MLLSFAIYSNDTLIRRKSGGNERISENPILFQLNGKKITIDLFEDYYHINVDYIFRKDGETTLLQTRQIKDGFG